MMINNKHNNIKYKHIRIREDTYKQLNRIRINEALRTFDNTIKFLIQHYNPNKTDELFNMMFNYLKSLSQQIDESKKEIITHISEIVPKKKKKFEKIDFRKWQKENVRCRFCGSANVKVTRIFVTKKGYFVAFRYVCNICKTREKVFLPEDIKVNRFISTTIPPIEET